MHGNSAGGPEVSASQYVFSAAAPTPTLQEFSAGFSTPVTARFPLSPAPTFLQP